MELKDIRDANDAPVDGVLRNPFNGIESSRVPDNTARAGEVHRNPFNGIESVNII